MKKLVYLLLFLSQLLTAQDEKIYHFDGSGIVEGKVSDEVARANKNHLNSLMKKASIDGYTRFVVPALDAYFETANTFAITFPAYRGITVPKGMHLELSEDTHLRTQPNPYPKTCLIGMVNDNSGISGGHLYGDRDEHDYSYRQKWPTHEWGNIMEIFAAKNIRVENVRFYNATGDGVHIYSKGFYFYSQKESTKSKYIPTKNVLIKGCTFDASRRNQISITDGHGIIVENNTFLRSGVDTEFSRGTLPRYAIDVEAQRSADKNGKLIEYQKATNVIIRNNTEKGGARGAFLAYVCDTISIHDNKTENDISSTYATNVKISNNVIKAPGERRRGSGIGIGTPNTRRVYGIVVSGNTIENYEVGITAYNRKLTISNNTVNNFRYNGVFLKEAEEAKIHGNTFNSVELGSTGLFMHETTGSEVDIYNNIMNVRGNPVKFVGVNKQGANSPNSIRVYKNKFNTPLSPIVSNSNGISLKGGK